MSLFSWIERDTKKERVAKALERIARALERQKLPFDWGTSYDRDRFEDEQNDD